MCQHRPRGRWGSRCLHRHRLHSCPGDLGDEGGQAASSAGTCSLPVATPLNLPSAPGASDGTQMWSPAAPAPPPLGTPEAGVSLRIAPVPRTVVAPGEAAARSPGQPSQEVQLCAVGGRHHSGWGVSPQPRKETGGRCPGPSTPCWPGAPQGVGLGQHPRPPPSRAVRLGPRVPLTVLTPGAGAGVWGSHRVEGGEESGGRFGPERGAPPGAAWPGPDPGLRTAGSSVPTSAWPPLGTRRQ